MRLGSVASGRGVPLLTRAYSTWPDLTSLPGIRPVCVRTDWRGAGTRNHL